MEHIIRVNTEVELEQESEVRQLILQCAKQALCHLDIDFVGFIDVTIVNDESIRILNRDYRGKDAVTDVLSFPMYQFKNGTPMEKLEKDPETERIMLGDMILNYSRAVQQAEEYGHSAARECGFLTVHSVLHLLGYDHEWNEDDRKLMRTKEEEILSSMGLTREDT